ncbi:hypothetical protein I4U23_012196 [Adineta vaga]|nr:hypothetical protein I4U23_012196 [Adineta vaga]
MRHSTSITPVSATPTYTTGHINQALRFNVNESQVVRSSLLNLIATSFTIDAWIYPNDFHNTEDRSIIDLCPKETSYECLCLTIRENSGNYYLHFDFFNDVCQGTANIRLNQWIHVTFTFDITTLEQKIYLNVNLDATKTASESFQGSPDSLTIGYVLLMDTYGWIDRLMVSNRAKSSCEILEEATLSVYLNFNTANAEQRIVFVLALA